MLETRRPRFRASPRLCLWSCRFLPARMIWIVPMLPLLLLMLLLMLLLLSLPLLPLRLLLLLHLLL